MHISISKFPASRLFALTFLLVGLAGCADDPVVVPPPPPPPAAPFPGITASLTINPAALPNYVSPTLPAHYAGLIGGPDDNGRFSTQTNAGAMLGRVLFYDKQLSINNARSCASCHVQGSAFSDPAQFSLGFDGTGLTGMHSMRLANARFFAPGSMFWDKRAASLEAQATEPIINAVEMGYDAAHGGLGVLTTKMKALAYYPELFQLAFGDSAITATRIQLAVAQYVRSIVSVNSRWDNGYAATFSPGLPDRGVNAPIPSFTPQENRGRELFFTPPPQGGGGCAACHVAPTFALAPNSRSNGLDAGETRIFKAPSLKNVGVAGRFMHDGRFTTLAQVIDHYDHGVLPGPALDNRLAPGGQPLRLNLSQADRDALVAFLQTLTDTQLQADARFQTPFRP